MAFEINLNDSWSPSPSLKLELTDDNEIKIWLNQKSQNLYQVRVLTLREAKVFLDGLKFVVQEVEK